MSFRSASDDFKIQERLNTDKSPETLFQSNYHKRHWGRKCEGSVFFCVGLVTIITALSFFESEQILTRVQRENEIRDTGFIQLETGKYSGLTDFGYFLGQGKFDFKDGSEVSGTWEDNVLHGDGEEIFPDKGEYSGHFKGSKKDGIGTFTWDSGAEYTGEWKNDQLNGSGHYSDGQGVLYSGEFLDNAFDYGTCTFKDDLGDYLLTYQDGGVVSA